MKNISTNKQKALNATYPQKTFSKITFNRLTSQHLKVVGTGLLLGSLACSNMAIANVKTEQNIEKTAVMTTGATIGAIAGGPFGFVLGIIGGAILTDINHTQDEKNAVLKEKTDAIAALERAVIQQELELAELDQLNQQKMTLEIKFATGSDSLDGASENNLVDLSQLLKEDKNLSIRIDGYTDPRGTDEYNNVLSIERAKSVAALLTDQGIDAKRIQVEGHGSSQAFTYENTLTGFAQQRRVDIEIYRQDSIPAVVSIN